MWRVVFYLAPIFIVVIAGPIWLASKRRGGSTWFPAQILTLLGLLGAFAALHQGVFGDDVRGPMNFAIATLGAAAGLLVSWIILPRAKK